MSNEQIKHSPLIRRVKLVVCRWVPLSNHHQSFQAVTPLASFWQGRFNTDDEVIIFPLEGNKRLKYLAILYTTRGSIPSLISIFLPLSLFPFLLFPSLCKTKIRNTVLGPGLLACLVRVSSQYAKISFDLHSGHVQEATNECINTWNNKSMNPAKINKLKKNKETQFLTSTVWSQQEDRRET